MFFIGEKPGSAQTMKLANNLLSATAMVATSEAVVMGVKSGLDPAVMIDVINAGSGLNTASRDKFPRSILPRTFDFGFATGLMVKDVRLCLEEMKALGLSMEVAEAVGRLWEVVIREMGPESDFTSAIKPIEKAAGVVVGGKRRSRGEVALTEFQVGKARREWRHAPNGREQKPAVIRSISWDAYDVSLRKSEVQAGAAAARYLAVTALAVLIAAGDDAPARSDRSDTPDRVHRVAQRRRAGHGHRFAPQPADHRLRRQGLDRAGAGVERPQGTRDARRQLQRHPESRGALLEPV